MENKYRYLLNLGYAEKEIECYTYNWDESIITYLADNSEVVFANMSYLKEDFDKDLLLKLPVFYSETFVSNPDVFKNRFEILKSEFPSNYADIVKMQFWGYDGTDAKYATLDVVKPDILYVPFLEAMSRDDVSVYESVESLKNPCSRIYKFILMLQTGADMDITAYDVSESFLLQLEASKYEVFSNAEFLIEQGLEQPHIRDIIQWCPCIMMYSTSEMERILVKQFGENYVEVMTQKADEDDWFDILRGLS